MHFLIYNREKKESTDSNSQWNSLGSIKQNHSTKNQTERSKKNACWKEIKSINPSSERMNKKKYPSNANGSRSNAMW